MEDLDVVLFWILIILGIVLFKYLSKRARKRRQKEELLKREESKRIRECGEVVLFFANHLGYLAREAISRYELEDLIDQGISAEDLACEIGSRTEEKSGLVLGHHSFGDFNFDVKLTQKFRDRHIYIIGKSGSGKTNLMRNLIYQDLQQNNGVGIISSEQDLITEQILPFIPRHRMGDVIYFNPADTERPVFFNPIHLDQGEDIDLRVDENLTIFRRIFEGTKGTRMEEILRQALYSLMEIKGSTLSDIPKLLDRNDPGFRNKVLKNIKNEDSIHFWRSTYLQLPKDSHLPIVSRLGRFIRPKTIKNVLCQSGKSLNFREAMDSGKILIFNLSDGILGELNSQLLGQLIVSKFQTAAMSRADIPENKRRRFYLYIDEFQTFTSTANVSYEKILSRARKYRLCLILAHQQTSQIPLDLLREIFGNVSTMVSFVVSHNDATKLSHEFTTQYNGNVDNIPTEEFLMLGVGGAYCKIGQTSFPMRTHLADQGPDYSLAKEVVNLSRSNWGSSLQGIPKKKVIEPREDLFKDIDPGKVF